MTKQVEDLQKQIEKAYKHMNKIPYHLHAILIHDGNVNSGHYYAYIYDRAQKKWRKYNDIRITEVTEEEVFKDSNGGWGWASAYWLVYIDDKIAQEISKTDLNQYEQKEVSFRDMKHPYIKNISEVQHK